MLSKQQKKEIWVRQWEFVARSVFSVPHLATGGGIPPNRQNRLLRNIAPTRVQIIRYCAIDSRTSTIFVLRPGRTTRNIIAGDRSANNLYRTIYLDFSRITYWEYAKKKKDIKSVKNVTSTMNLLKNILIRPRQDRNNCQ